MSTIVKLFFSKTGFGEEELDSGGQGIGHQSQISYRAQFDGGMQIYQPVVVHMAKTVSTD